MKKGKHLLRFLLLVLVAVVVIFFLRSVTNLENGQAAEDKRQLEETLRRAVVACYAVEGAYPPTIEYLLDNYGITYNQEKYVIKYEYYGSNLIPDITVLDQ